MSATQIDGAQVRRTATQVEPPAEATRRDCRVRPGLTVKVPGDEHAVRRGEPVTVGLPFPPGMCRDEMRIVASGPAGPVATQTQVLERWPDGSIRWALLDFQVDAPHRYDVLVESSLPPIDGLVVGQNDGAAEIASGDCRFRVGLTGEFQLEVSRDAQEAPSRKVFLELTRSNGTVSHADVRSVAWETTGPLRSVLRVGATIDAGNQRTLDAVLRLHFYARLGTVRFDVTLCNRSRAEHRGGFWELGDPGSLLIRDCSIRVVTPTQAVRYSVAPGEELATTPVPFELYQDSSGGTHWDSRVHVNRNGSVPGSFCGYRLTSGTEVTRGRRATPVVLGESAENTFTGVAVQHFWQNAPKSLEAGSTGLRLRLFPGQFPDLHEIQGGEQKTHVFHLAFEAERIAPLPLDWARQPVFASADPAWYSHAGAVRYLTPVSEDPNGDYRQLVNAAIEGPDRFEAKRETIDEYGWRNFGDIFADHEAVYAKDPSPIVSHYNNQYDAIAGFACQFLITGDERWWRGMQELARHVADIDIYHTLDDKAAYNGGLFWHSSHYRDAGRSTHRSYPKAPGIFGGGPSNEHAYSTGFLLHYLLTGDPLSREAALSLADWILRSDDGNLTIFRWLSRQHTGLASATGSPDYHGPGRGAGNAIAVLLNGYRLTHDRRYLSKAEALLRRVIHPRDDIAARGLDNPELRWSYTVFLQTVGRYLDEKMERSELDQPYAYARDSLLHYARWMADHEHCYLDRPAVLEYPTETWAAQDMRKSEVFGFAARYSSGEERERFSERADYFYTESVRQLREHSTRGLARPLVILMVCGFRREALKHDHVLLPDVRLSTEGKPATFVPQKETVRRRLKQGAVFAAAIVLLLTIVVLSSLLS